MHMQLNRVISRAASILLLGLLFTAQSNFAVQPLVLDQQQTNYSGGGLSARTLPGYTVWQTFTAGRSGILSRIEMGFFNPISGKGELRIYEGEGTAGRLLSSSSVEVTSKGSLEPNWNSWTIRVPIHRGSRYTFEFVPDATTMPDPFGVCLPRLDNPYLGGHMGISDPSGVYPQSYDALFRTFVVPVEFLSIRSSEVEVCWDGDSGKSYLIQYRSTLTTNQWVNLSGVIKGTGKVECVQDKIPQGEPARFYRIEVVATEP